VCYLRADLVNEGGTWQRGGVVMIKTRHTESSTAPCVTRPRTERQSHRHQVVKVRPGSNGLFSRFHSKNNINVLILMPQLALSRNTRGGGARVAISKTSIHRIMTTDAQGFPSEKCIFTWPRLFQRVRHAGGRGQSKHGSCSYAWLMAAAALQLRHRPSSKSS